MGCAASTETHQNIHPLNQASSTIIKNDSQINESKASKVRSQSKITINSKNKEKKEKSSNKTLRNMHASTKSLKKQQPRQTEADSGILRSSSQRRMSLSPSKITLKIEEIHSVNEQEVELSVSAQKKKRKVKRKKTELDPRLGQLMKIYAV